MDKGPLISFIQKFMPVSRQVSELVAEQFEPVTIKKNDFFLEEGKISNYLFLAEGLMRAYTYDINGNEVTTYFYPKNRIVFEVSSFFLMTRSTESIQAVTDCEGYFLTMEKLNLLFHSIPEFREFGREMLAREFASFKQRTLALINKSAEERYVGLMESNKEVLLHAQQKHIASYLGVTDTSLSRIRREYLKKH